MLGIFILIVQRLNLRLMPRVASSSKRLSIICIIIFFSFEMIVVGGGVQEVRLNQKPIILLRAFETGSGAVAIPGHLGEQFRPSTIFPD